MEKKGHSSKEIVSASIILLVCYFGVYLITDFLKKRSQEIARIERALIKEVPKRKRTIPYDYSNNDELRNRKGPIPYDYYFFNDEELSPIVYDSMKIQEGSFDDLILDRNDDKIFSVEEMKKRLEENSHLLNNDLCLWYEEDVYDAIYKYNKIKPIPYALIKRLIPKIERRNQLLIKDIVETEGKSNNEKKETQVVFRKIEKLYAVNKPLGHLQLIVLGYGDIYPTIQLITLNKENLKYVDSVIFYKMEINEGDLFRWKGCLNKAFDTLKVWEIKGESDTLNYYYEILDSGKIILKL